VEFMVMLRRKREAVRDRSPVGDDPEHPFPGKLFREYERPGEPPAEANIRKELERILEEARQALLKSSFARCRSSFTRKGCIQHAAAWRWSGLISLHPSRASCHPITLKKEHARELMDYAGRGGTYLCRDTTGRLDRLFCFPAGSEIHRTGEKAAPLS
jgi:hypothetical protein